MFNFHNKLEKRDSTMLAETHSSSLPALFKTGNSGLTPHTRSTQIRKQQRSQIRLLSYSVGTVTNELIIWNIPKSVRGCWCVFLNRKWPNEISFSTIRGQVMDLRFIGFVWVRIKADGLIIFVGFSDGYLCFFGGLVIWRKSVWAVFEFWDDGGSEGWSLSCQTKCGLYWNGRNGSISNKDTA